MVKLDHINMTVTNLKESIAWYNNVFNFKLVEEGRSSSGLLFSVLKNQDSSLCLYEDSTLKQPSQSHGVHKVHHFGLRVNDRQQWEKTIKDKGVDIDHTAKYPHSFSWYLYDPSGHEIDVTFWDNNEITFD